MSNLRGGILRIFIFEDYRHFFIELIQTSVYNLENSGQGEITKTSKSEILF